MTSHTPETLSELCEAVRASNRVIAVGQGTKTAMRVDDHDAAPVAIDLTRLQGIVEYDPTEFTMTAYAGTTVAAAQAALAEHGQYLPFDPPFVEQGATLGGAVASGISGPGRWRFGGLRDFILGVQLIDGNGQLIRGGGKVVKNAAGFDLPKLVVGSCGWYGGLTEITFKVFPRPLHTVTLAARFESMAACCQQLAVVLRQPFDLDAVEMEPSRQASGARCLFRMAGEPKSIEAHARRLESVLGVEARPMDDDAARRYWQKYALHDWVSSEERLIRVPWGLGAVEMLEDALETLRETSGVRIVSRYSMAGNLVWIAYDGQLPPEEFDRFLQSVDPSRVHAWQMVLGRGRPCGRMPATSWPFAKRIKDALDPQHRWVSVLDDFIWQEHSAAEAETREEANP